MRIFYAAPDYALDRKTIVTNLWRANLYDSLVDLGHDLVEFNIDYEPLRSLRDPQTTEQHDKVRQNRARFSEQLLDQVRAAHRQSPIDLFFSYFYSAYVESDAIAEIRRLGIPTVISSADKAPTLRSYYHRMVVSSAHPRIHSANTNAGQAIASGSIGESPRSTASERSATSSTTRTGGSPSPTHDSPSQWATEAAFPFLEPSPKPTACSPNKSPPSTSSKLKVEAEPSTNGKPAPSNPTMCGLALLCFDRR
ncbi:MAG: hypothetical protein OSA98_07505 [Rubripirellula sp.]|nr:hypothetical protein [Rubripirellula sp.]